MSGRSDLREVFRAFALGCIEQGLTPPHRMVMEPESWKKLAVESLKDRTRDRLARRGVKLNPEQVTDVIFNVNGHIIDVTPSRPITDFIEV